MLLYLYSCCYNRPFDDLSQIRVRLEAEAVEWILEESRSERFTIVTSDYLVTADDGLLKKSRRDSGHLPVSVLNPIDIVSLP